MCHLSLLLGRQVSRFLAICQRTETLPRCRRSLLLEKWRVMGVGCQGFRGGERRGEEKGDVREANG